MRVLLVPPTHKYTAYPEPLSVSDFPMAYPYLAAILKQAGHEVHGFSPNNIFGYVNGPAMLQDTLTRKLKEIQPEVVGLGGLATDYAFLRDAIGIVRGVDPSIKVVLGGQIVTNDAEQVFNLLKPDYAIKGEGELGLPAVLKVPNDVGLSMGVVESPPVHDLDTLPMPDYEPFNIREMLDGYSMATRLLYRYSRPNPRPFNLVASRSCPFQCSFCIHGHRNIPYRARSIPNVMAEIEQMYDKYGFNVLILLDELFAVNKERMTEFCESVLDFKRRTKADFDFMFQTHASSKLDAKTLRLAKEAGCFLFSYGLESASPTVLKSMNKKIEPSQVADAIKLAQEAGIGFSANLIFGDPAETPATMAESISFWLTHCRDAMVFMSHISPYPGSALFEGLEKAGKVPDRKNYYEHIDQGIINMTQIRSNEFTGLTKWYQDGGNGWNFCQVAPVSKCEQLPDTDKFLEWAGGHYYKITAKCPHCGHETEYRERLNVTGNFWLGTGCTWCNKKIKVVKG